MQNLQASACLMDEREQQLDGPMHAPQALPATPEPFDAAVGAEELARDLVALRTHAPNATIGAAILRRFDTSGAPGLHAAELGRRFAPRALRAEPLAMTVSPYAPPQRQLSVVRQGAPMWRGPAMHAPTITEAPEQTSSAPEMPAPPPPRVAASDPSELPGDLKALLALHRSKGNI